MILRNRKIKCFNCNETIKSPEQPFTIKLDTADGPHEVKMCFDCSQIFNKLAMELEEVIGERSQSI